MTYQDFIVQYPYENDSRVTKDLWNAALALASDIAQDYHDALPKDIDLAAARAAALEIKQLIVDKVAP